MRTSASVVLLATLVGVQLVGGCVSGGNPEELRKRALREATTRAGNLRVEMTQLYGLVSNAPDAPLLRMLDDAMEDNEHTSWAEKRSGTPSTSVWDVTFMADAQGGGMLPPVVTVRVCAELSVDLGRETVVELDDSTCPPGAPRPSGAVDVDLPDDVR